MAFEQIAALIVFAALGWVGFFLMWWRHRKAMELLTRSNAQFNAIAAEASRSLDLACSWRNIAERRFDVILLHHDGIAHRSCVDCSACSEIADPLG